MREKCRCGAPSMRVQVLGEEFDTGLCSGCHTLRGEMHDRWRLARERAELDRAREAKAIRDAEATGKGTPIRPVRRAFEDGAVE